MRVQYIEKKKKNYQIKKKTYLSYIKFIYPFSNILNTLNKVYQEVLRNKIAKIFQANEKGLIISLKVALHILLPIFAGHFFRKYLSYYLKLSQSFFLHLTKQ